MKKLFSLLPAFLLLGLAANAQTTAPAYVPAALNENVHENVGSGFMRHAVRVRAQVVPNPVVTRAIVDAGGAVIRTIVIRNEDGRVLQNNSNLNVLRFPVERPNFSPGLYLVEVVTDYGSATIKMRVQ